MSKVPAILVVLCLLFFKCSTTARQWVQTTSLPDGYFGHSLVYSSGYLYQAGGNNNADFIFGGTNVFYAQVHSDGSVGTWNSATPLPDAVDYHGGADGNGFVYVLGGYHYSQANGLFLANIVYYSQINSDGSLGAWTTATATPLPQNLSSFGTAVWNNTIYVVGGMNESSAVSNVYSAQIQTNGTLSSWTTQNSLPVATWTQAAAANGCLYVLGGLLNNADYLQTVYYTKINADGSLAGWNQTTQLLQPVGLLGAVAANGSIFSIGGQIDSESTSNCYIAAVNGDGSLGSWSSGNALPQPIDYEAVAHNNSYIFLTGGIDSNGVGLSSVYAMALPAPPVTPKLVARSFINGNFQFKLTSSTNTGFGVRASINLNSWTNLGWGFTDTNGSLLFQDTNAASFSNRFYQAYWPLP